MGVVYFQTKIDQDGVYNIYGVCFFMITTCTFANIGAVTFVSVTITYYFSKHVFLFLPVHLFRVCYTLCCVYIYMPICHHCMSVWRQFSLKFFLSLIVPLSVYYYIYLIYKYSLLLYCDWQRPGQFIVSFFILHYNT